MIPGPRATRARLALDKIWDTKSLNIMCDFENSVGNYMSDADGNVCFPIIPMTSSEAGLDFTMLKNIREGGGEVNKTMPGC